MNEVPQRLNIKEMYENVDANIEEIQLAITKFHIAIWQLIDAALGCEVKLETYEEVWNRFLSLLKQSSEITQEPAEEVLNGIHTSAVDLMKEFARREDPARSMLFLIGTNSEVPQNYTMTERMIILTAYARFVGVNLIFE